MDRRGLRRLDNRPSVGLAVARVEGDGAWTNHAGHGDAGSGDGFAIGRCRLPDEHVLHVVPDDGRHDAALRRADDPLLQRARARCPGEKDPLRANIDFRRHVFGCLGRILGAGDRRPVASRAVRRGVGDDARVRQSAHWRLSSDRRRPLSGHAAEASVPRHVPFADVVSDAIFGGRAGRARRGLASCTE